MSDFNYFNIPRLTEEEFGRFARLIYHESGINLKENKITLLSNRLRKRLKELSITSYSDYYNYIQQSQNRDEIHGLLDVVSTNETYFFRNDKQFEALELVIKKYGQIANKQKLRIWSAGCSTGEEPYTIGIILLEYRNILKNIECEIIATDISGSVLKFARTGRYSGRRIEKVKPELQKKYFKKTDVDGEIEVNSELKSLVKFGNLNLFKDPYPGHLDIIFCRNVMIYFDKIYQKKLVDGFSRVINEDGYLFIGHAETLYNLTDTFAYSKIGESPVYRKGK